MGYDRRSVIREIAGPAHQEVAMKNANLHSPCSLLGSALQQYFCQYLIGQRTGNLEIAA
jgi:hypothetical protein